VTTLRRAAHLAFLLVVCAWPAAGGQTPGEALTVSYGASAVSPGDLVLITVTAASADAAPEGEAFGRPVTFWAGDTPHVWHAFVAVALDTPAGTHDVVVRTGGAVANAAEGRVGLQVADKQFETRQLRVASQFVNPPAAESRRIERDARRLAEVFTRTTDRAWRGPFAPPVPGRSTSSFGRLSMMNGEPRGRHLGADFSARTGTPVRAPNAGRVALAEDLFLSGNTVIVDHGGGLFSLVAHLSRIDVKEGEMVSRGDVLGASGATGRVTGPHVHWAVRLGPISVDPQSLIAAVASLDETPETLIAR
jgi:murein DD-endopeptidase MepM/ murein hydrolase activator NlpD